MKNLFLLLLLFVSFQLMGQSDSIYPAYRGGSKALSDFFSNNLQYPDEARSINVAGEVVVSFIVDENGRVSNPQIVSGLPGGCNEEALRLVKLTDGMWTPGLVSYIPVRMTKIVSVSFQSRNDYTGDDPYHAGLELMKQANYTGAIEELSIFLSTTRTPEALFARGVCYLALEDYRNAISDLEAANSNSDPATREKLAEAYLKYGNKYFDQKNFPQAVDMFSKSLNYGPGNVKVLLNRGTAYYKMGNKASACSDWKAISSAGSHDADENLKSNCN